jgi:hypothetical protein
MKRALGWAAIVYAVCVVCLGTVVIKARTERPIAVAETMGLLGTSDNCVPPCWLGIQAGVTTEAQARDLLGTHAWIGEIEVVDGLNTSDRLLYWAWSGAQPAMVDSTRTGRLWTRGGVVYLIEVPLNVQLDVLWSAFGLPDAVYYDMAPPSAPTVSRVLSYHHDSLEFVSVLWCPLRIPRFFTASLTARITSLARIGPTKPALLPEGC